MTLQSSGAISLANVQTEFGGSNPISFSEYYAGGGLVPSGTSGVNGAVPTSGTLAMSKFYGTSAIVITGSNSSIYSDASGGPGVASVSSSASLQFKTSGDISSSVSSGFIPIDLSNFVNDSGNTQIGTATPASAISIRATLISGSTPSGTLNTWLALTTQWNFSLSTSVSTVNQTATASANVKIEFAATTNTSNIIKTIYYNIESSSTSTS